LRERLLQLFSSLPPERGAYEKGSAMWMRCPNKEHAGGMEDTASFSVSLDPPFSGSCYCFGCGIHGSWKKVTAPLLGITGSAVELPETVYDAISDDDEARMLGKSAKTKERGFREKWPKSQNWRGVPGSLIADLGGALILNGDGREPMLRLPAMIRGAEKGYIDCKIRPTKDDTRKYFNSSGIWTRDALFPFDYVRDQDPKILAIVEGPRDALVTIKNGLPALATLGAQSWSKKCANLVLSIAPKHLIVMADPDDAGQKLVRMVYRDLSPHMWVRSILLPSKITTKPNGVKVRKKLVDPADLSKAQLKRVLDKAGIELEGG
jgi:5S rRNA maturation endonuclease (ribonuclease M5)